MGMVTLTLKKESYAFLRRTVNEHKTFLCKVKMPDLVKQELVKDVSKINSVLDEGVNANREEA